MEPNIHLAPTTKRELRQFHVPVRASTPVRSKPGPGELCTGPQIGDIPADSIGPPPVLTKLDAPGSPWPRGPHDVDSIPKPSLKGYIRYTKFFRQAIFAKDRLWPSDASPNPNGFPVFTVQGQNTDSLGWRAGVDFLRGRKQRLEMARTGVGGTWCGPWILSPVPACCGPVWMLLYKLQKLLWPWLRYANHIFHILGRMS